MASSSTNETTSITTRDRGRAGVVVLLELGDDEQRRDLGLHRHVAGDEDDRAVLAERAREREREAGQRAPAAWPGRITRRKVCQRRRAEARRRLLDLGVEILAAPAARVRTTNGSPMKVSAIDDAERRERDLDAERLEQRPSQPFGA